MKPVVRLKAAVISRETSSIKKEIIEKNMDIEIMDQEKYFWGVIVSPGITKQRFYEGQDVLVYIPRDYTFFPNTLNVPHDFDEFVLIPMPPKINKKEALIAGSVALKILNGLFQKGHFIEKENVLIIGLHFHYAYILLQIILNLKGSVTLILNTTEEYEKMQNLLEILKMKDAKSITLLHKSDNYFQNIMSKTSHLGVDLVLDFLTIHQDEDSKNLISLLTPNGRWVISDDLDFQLNPPESRSLFLKNASLCFNFEESYAFFKYEIGKALNIIEQMMEFLEEGFFKVFIDGEIKNEEESGNYSIFTEKKILGSIILNLENK